MSDTASNSCPGCGNIFNKTLSSDGQLIPSREFILHCLFQCSKYQELKLDVQCSRCNTWCINKDELDSHLDIDCYQDVEMEDEDNDQEVKDQEAKGQEVDTVTKYEPVIEDSRCPTCGILFPDVSNKNNHVKAVHEDFKCPKCVYTATKMWQILAHGHIKDDPSLLQKTAASIDTINWAHYYYKNKCDICDSVVSKTTDKQRHMTRHFGVRYQCPSCDTSINCLSDLRAHVRANHSYELQIKVNPFWLLPKTELEVSNIVQDVKMEPRVTETHITESVKHFSDIVADTRCTTCGMLFPDIANKNNHVRTVHEDLKCPKCDFTANQTWVFMNHGHIKDNPSLVERSSASFALKWRQYFTSTLNKNKCNLCDEAVQGKREKKRHLVRHAGFNYQCPFCYTVKNCFHDLKSHFKTCHGRHLTEKVDPTWILPRIDREGRAQEQDLSNSDLKVSNSDRVDLPEDTRCTTCGILFPDIANKNNHVRTVHEDLECPKCDFTANKIWLFMDHDHIKDNPSLVERTSASFDFDWTLYLKQDKCNICQDAIQSKKYKEIHLTKHVGLNYQCPSCYTIKNCLQDLKLHFKKFHDQILTEKVDPIWILPRIDQVIPRQVYKCKVCKIKFPDSLNLKYHVEAVHELIKCHKCNYIPKFKDKSTNHVHMFQHHLHYQRDIFDRVDYNLKLRCDKYTKGLICKICNKNFNKQSNISDKQKHFLRHVGCRYQCPDCDFTFSCSRPAFKDHVQHAHKRTLHESEYKLIWLIPKDHLKIRK